MYFKLLELFLLRTLFTRGEYDIKNKNFNPVKFIFINVLLFSFVFNIYLIGKMSSIYDRLLYTCPNIAKTSNSTLHKLETTLDKVKHLGDNKAVPQATK